MTTHVLLVLVAAVALGACTASGGGPCKAITCSGFGKCVAEAGAARCECAPGFQADGLHCVDPGAGVPTTDQVVQWGIAFTFNGQYAYGQYANGDYWVVGPVTVTRITPDFTGKHHGWEVNPSDPEAQGFEHRIASFDAGRVPELPYVAQPGQSLVKVISLSPLSDGGCRPCVQTAAVLTIVADVPPDQGTTLFRPPYAGPDKVEYSVHALDLALLPSLAPVDSAPTLSTVEDWFRRVQLDHKVNWTGRPLHPVDNMPDYGSSIASRSAEAALRLMLDDPIADKMQALVNYLQYGIDLYHMVEQGSYFPPGGGHGEGRKLPVALAGVLLNDPGLLTLAGSAPDGTFGEDGGMYYSPSADAVIFGQTENSEERYWSNLVNDDGSRTNIDPYGWIDGGHRPGGSYQFCCTALPWKSTATAVYLMPELDLAWNYPEFVEYVTRWVTFGAWTQPDPCAPPDGECRGGNNRNALCTSANEDTVCTGEDGYCDLTVNWETTYGVTYGPDGQGGCIPDTDPSDGTGRFPQLHGASTDDGHYGSGFANDLWDAYVAPNLP